MNKHKNIVLGLSVLVATIAFISFGGKALALTQAQLQSATYKITPPAVIDATIGGTQIKFVDKNPIDNDQFLKANYKPQSNQFCITTIYDPPIDTNKGITLLENFEGAVAGKIPATIDVDYKDANGNCATYKATLTFTKQADGTFTTGGATGGAVDAADGDAADDTPTCENSDRLGLGWIFCKVLRGIDSAVSAFYDEVKDQLCVQVDANATNNSTAGSVNCGKQNLFTDQLHDAWSNMRIIATSLLVIVMLIAIIGQAVGGGRQ